MSKPIIYIDGKEGTTGLQIFERLGGRTDIELILIDEDKRKDTAERKKLLNAADLVFLCLPDKAAMEAVSLIENDNTRVIDASTAHRTHSGWVYGFPELLPAQRSKVKVAKRVANPGCHATGFLSAVAPLTHLNILPKSYPLTCQSITGYSGGGKPMIAQYRAEERDIALSAPSPYAMGLCHKHLPEMQAVAGLQYSPAFSPILGDFEKGMATSVLLHSHLLTRPLSAKNIYDFLASYYEGEKLITVRPFGETTSVYANALAGRDGLELIVTGHSDQIMITALFDNLGKGASGGAVQNMNLMLGFAETAGLTL